MSVLVNLKRLLFVAIFAASTMTAHGSDQPRAVVELFTSQGCSSCPAADKILSQYAQSDDVLALSFHVDYWNYLGWKDTFSKAKFTERQQRYAASFRRRGVYTPQAVVNGRDHAVGSRREDIEALMKDYAATGKGLNVPIKTQRSGDRLRITSTTETGDATVYVVYFDRSKKVAIKRGENRGRTIIYHNVVRDMSMLGMTKEGRLDITLPLEEMRQRGFDSCAILLQRSAAGGTPGAIVGATVIDNFDS